MEFIEFFPKKSIVTKREAIGHRKLHSWTSAGVSEAIVIVTPFEVVKTRLQQQRGVDKASLKYHGMFHCAKVVIKEEGITALVRSLLFREILLFID